MRLTAKYISVIGLAAAIFATIISFVLTKSDTPIVIVGGCVHPRTGRQWAADQRNRQYHAFAGGHGDGFTLTNFDHTASQTLSGTGRWAVTYTVRGNSQSSSKAMVCSDKNCDASTMDLDGRPKQPSCSSPVDQTRPVYVASGSGEHWIELSAPVDRLALKENDAACVPDSGQPDGACEKVVSVLVETCNRIQGPDKGQLSRTYLCTPTGTNESEGCNLTVN